MKNVLIKENCKYAQRKPSMPILEFIEGKVYSLDNDLAESVIRNEHGFEDKPKSVEPEIKEKPIKKSVRGKKGK